MAPEESTLSNQNNRFSILGKQDCHDIDKNKNSKLKGRRGRQRELRDLSKILEDFFLRFPHLSEAVFDNLDNKSLARCRKVGRTWTNCLDAHKFLLGPSI
jgi:hypothetical protein